MGAWTVRIALCFGLMNFWFGSLWAGCSDQPASVEVLVERAERISQDEVHFRLKLTSKSSRPVFLAGINYDTGPSPLLVFIEHWRPKEGWKRSYCMDTRPPHVLKLNPGETITDDLALTLPMSVVCRNPITRLEGKFRFRLEYFDNEQALDTYLGRLFGETEREVEPHIAVSKTFEIPPYHVPKE